MRVEIEVEAAAEVEIRKRAERAEGKNERLTMLAPSDASHIQRAAVEAVEEGLSCALFLQLRLVLFPFVDGIATLSPPRYQSNAAEQRKNK